MAQIVKADMRHIQIFKQLSKLGRYPRRGDMAKQKSIPKLEAEKAENERKLSQLQHKKQQIENRITYYEKGDRRKRAHHLITRGAAIESVAPLTKVLTETEFYTFAEKVLAVPEIKSLIMEAVNEHNRAEQKERY